MRVSLSQLLTCVIWLSSTVFPTGCVSSPPSARQATTSVLAYNIYVDFEGDGWTGRNEVVHSFIERNEFDIIALQEVSEFQMADIARRHSGYNYIVGERSDGHRGDQNWYEYVPILYKRERYELVEESSFWVSETPWHPGSIMPGTKDHGRVFTWVQLHDKYSNEKILVGNIHIHGLRASEEIGSIIGVLQGLDHHGPIILLGDFNMMPETAGYKKMVGEKIYGNFTDARALAKTRVGPTETTIGGDEFTNDNDGQKKKINFRKQIDYIFTCGVGNISSFTTEPNSYGITSQFASDHFAVHATISDFFACKLVTASD